MSHHKPWTSTELATLHQHAHQGATTCALLLGRTTKAVRRQAFTAADLEAPDWCAACGNIAVAWPGVVCDICQNEAKS